MAKQDAKTKVEGVQSVGRALGLLDLLGQSDEGARVSDLARAAGLAVSTTHRLLTSLELYGYAQFDQANALWRVGRQAYVVGAAYTRRRNYVAAALPFLRRLRDMTRETVNLGILDDDYLVTISQVESREIVRAISTPGGRVPAFCSAMGKALLATWPDEEIAAFANRVGFHPMTPRSHRNLGTAMEDIWQCRARGYALDDEEHVSGLRCIGAAVRSPQGEAVCAISVSGLTSRLDRARIPEVGAQVVEAAEALTRRLSGGATLEVTTE